MIVRPLRVADAAAVARLLRAAEPAPEPAAPAPAGADAGPRSLPADPRAAAGPSVAAAGGWEPRVRHLLATDPAGCHGAQDGADLVGVSLALRREKLWALATLAVAPGHRHAGVGRQLFDAALDYSRGCLRGLLLVPPDPRAARMVRRAGFTLHPAMRLDGVVDPAAPPAVEAVRPGGRGDRDLLDSVDRRIRGAAHGVDHELLAAEHALLVCDTLTGSGYCYLAADGSPALLAATSRQLAGRLLWAALGRARPGQPVGIVHLTAAQEWAVDIGLAAGLDVRNAGYLAVRHMRPPAPYLPATTFL